MPKTRKSQSAPAHVDKTSPIAKSDEKVIDQFEEARRFVSKLLDKNESPAFAVYAKIIKRLTPLLDDLDKQPRRDNNEVIAYLYAAQAHAYVKCWEITFNNLLNEMWCKKSNKLIPDNIKPAGKKELLKEFNAEEQTVIHNFNKADEYNPRNKAQIARDRSHAATVAHEFRELLDNAIREDNFKGLATFIRQKLGIAASPEQPTKSSPRKTPRKPISRKTAAAAAEAIVASEEKVADAQKDKSLAAAAVPVAAVANPSIKESAAAAPKILDPLTFDVTKFVALYPPPALAEPSVILYKREKRKISQIGPVTGNPHKAKSNTDSKIEAKKDNPATAVVPSNSAPPLLAAAAARPAINPKSAPLSGALGARSFWSPAPRGPYAMIASAAGLTNAATGTAAASPQQPLKL